MGITEREDVTGGFRKWHNEEPRTLWCSSPNIIAIVKIKEDEMDRECGMHEAEQKCIQGLVDKPEERRPLGKSMHMWKNNIKMDLNKTETGGCGLFCLADDSDKRRGLVNTEMNLSVL